MAFFREAADTRNTVIPLCTISMSQLLDKFGMGSFGEASAIIDSGIEEGRRLYPRLKALADSLNAIYGPQDIVKSRLPEAHPVKLSSYTVTGLKNTSEGFFIQSMDLGTNRFYTANNLSRMVRRAFGTRYYNSITYTLVPLPNGSSRIDFQVDENALTFAKIGPTMYNQFSGISAILES